MSRKKIIILGILIAVLIAAAIGCWYYQKSREAQNAIKQAGDFLKNLGDSAAQGVLPSIDPKSNPLENSPDINPVSKTNPFTDIKTNPFK